MFRKFKFSTVFVACAVMALGTGCGGDDANTPIPTADSGAPQDTGPTDTGVRDTGVRDTGPADAGVSNAGAVCTGADDPVCGDTLMCTLLDGAAMCSARCENNSNQAMEREGCGGRGSTCLNLGMSAFCTRACTPTARTVAAGQCRSGQVCTGLWLAQPMGSPDNPGCYTFCQEDSHCPMGSRCNTRLGTCGMRTVDMTLLPDGSPCNPSMTTMVPGEPRPRNNQCRGACLQVSAMRGICASFINTFATTECPDSPDNFAPRGPEGDNFAICIFRNCQTNNDCMAPLRCIYPETMGMVLDTQPRICNYPTTAQPTGVEGDGGAPVGDGGVPTDGPQPDGGAPMDAGTPADAGAPVDRPATTG